MQDAATTQRMLVKKQADNRAVSATASKLANPSQGLASTQSTEPAGMHAANAAEASTASKLPGPSQGVASTHQTESASTHAEKAAEA